MASEWNEFTVEELKSPEPNALATGPFGSAISSKYFVQSGTPVIRGSNLSQDVGVRLVEDDFVFVDDGKTKEFTRSIARKGDLVFTCWGTIDQVGLIDKRSRYEQYIVSNKQMKFTPDRNKADCLFLYYVLSSPQIRDRIVGEGIGSSVPGFNLGQLRALKLNIPHLSVQNAIARILGTLDDKIELNRQMNKTLAEMARALFKSWFVDFDPVRANAEGRDTRLPQPVADLFPDSFEDSKLGKIPKGWHVGTVDEDFNLTMGQSPPGETYNEIGEGIPFFQGRSDFGFRFPRKRVYCTAPTRFAQAGDTLVSVRAPVGDINMAAEQCCVGRGVAAVRHKSGSRSYTYYYMHSLRQVFDKFEAEGTVFGSIGKQDFHAIIRVAPPDSLVSEFERMTYPLDESIGAKTHEIQTLSALRDALLPKLVSGALRIRDVERIVGGHV
jgi:type I restriction enzyme S subunit